METNMTEGRPLPILLRFTIPLLIGNIFQQLYNMVDSIIVGNFVGEKALAAVGSTGTIMFLVIGLSSGMSTGFTILTSQKFGAGDTEGCRRSVASGILLSAAVIVVLTILSLLAMNPLLKLMNTPADIFSDAYSYISVICIGIFATMYYNLFSSYLRAVGNSRVPLYFLIFSACLNVVLDLLFVIVFRMGTAGAAWATDISQGLAALLCLLYICRKVPFLTPSRRHWKMNRSYARNQLSVGIPMALQFGITASGTMVMQTAINMFGSTAVAGFTAASKVQGLLTQGFGSMGQAMASYSGQNYGKMDLARIRQGNRLAMLSMVVYSVAAAAVSLFCLPYMMQLFFSPGVDLSQMMPWAEIYVRECVIFYIPLAAIFIFRNTIQGCGFGLEAMIGGIVELAARLAAALSAMGLGSYPLAAGADAAAWLAAGIFFIFMYRHVMRKIENRGFRKVE